MDWIEIRKTIFIYNIDEPIPLTEISSNLSNCMY
jgi:hypothetical protein